MSLPAAPLPASSIEINEFSFNCTRRLGCSQLMEVRNTRTGVMHCGKLIPKSAVPQFLQQEGLVYKVLKAHPHPNILLPKTVVEGDEYCGVIFDTVGEDVHTYVRRCGSGLPEREAKAVFHSIASAIAHLHSLRIVARDLRLGKIFLQDAKSLNVVLADLDGAQMVSRENPFLSDRKGSPAFVSPEVVVAPSFDAAAADMWALGVVLYILLRGAYPFHDTHPATLFQKIQQGHSAIYFHPSMSEAACDIIRSLLTKEPHLRLTGAQLMKDLWFSTPTVSTAPSAFLQAVPSARAPLSNKRPATKPLSEEVILERLKRMKNIVSPSAASPSQARDVDPVVLL